MQFFALSKATISKYCSAVKKNFSFQKDESFALCVMKSLRQSRRVVIFRLTPFGQTLRIMKIIAFLMLVTCMQVCAKGGFSQEINLSEKNSPLEKVLSEIRKQTGYSFLYNENLLQKSKAVTIEVKNSTLDKVLNLIFKNQPFTYNIFGGNIIAIKERIDPIENSILTSIEVKGRITDEKTNPVIRATISEKGTSNSTFSNDNGEFIITADENATLLISSVGFERKEVKIDRKAILNIQLKIAANDLEIVTVFTGYQDIPKERTTGSFTQIDNQLFNEQVSTDILSRLPNIANGLTKLSQTTINSGRIAPAKGITIRGINTLTSKIADPLIVVDNFPYEGDISNINPNDVATITLLKDAAAASIWGAKAANGVIVITTKKAKLNQSFKIDANSNVTVSNKPDLFQIKSIKTTDLIDFEQYLFNNDYRFSDTLSSDHYPFSPIYEILFRQKRGEISASEAQSLISNLRNLDVRNDFNKYFYQKAVNQQYSISFQEGTNNLAYKFSIGFDKNISELNSKYNRINIGLNTLYKPTKNLDINTEIYFTSSKTNTGKPAYGSIPFVRQGLPSYSQFADANGIALPIYNFYRQGFIDTLGGGKLLDWRYFPLDDYKHSHNKSLIQDINAVVGLKYKILNFLSIDMKYRYEKQRTEVTNLQDQDSYFARNLINTFSQINSGTGTINYVVPKGGILDKAYNSVNAQDFRSQLNFSKVWGMHSLVSIIGMQISETINDNNNYRTYGYDNEVLTYSNVDYVNQYSTIINGGASFIPNPADFLKTNTRFVSYYANAAYSFNDKYSLSVSARRDASNLFGVNINDKWKPLWSAGAGWNLSKENFYDIPFLPYLKLRLTYGSQGNVDPAKVGVTTFSYIGTNPYSQTPYAQVQNIYNPELKWEEVRMFNFGIDFGTKNNRITGSLEYFTKNIKDLYDNAPVDPTAGLQRESMVRNVGNMKGSGVDIEIQALIMNQEFKWSTDLIFDMYKDKITKRNIILSSSSVIGGGIAQGYSAYSYFSYKWAGLDPLTGDPQGYLNKALSKDYSAITSASYPFDDLVYVGTVNPTVYGSLGNTFSWKNITVNARLIYKFGYYFKRESINYSNLINTITGHPDYYNRWQKPGDETITDIPSFTFPSSTARDAFYNNSELLATKGDHIRLQ